MFRLDHGTPTDNPTARTRTPRCSLYAPHREHTPTRNRHRAALQPAGVRVPTATVRAMFMYTLPPQTITS